MAQADWGVVTKQQKTILSILRFPRGFRGFRDLLEKYDSLFSTAMDIQAKECYKLLTEQLDKFTIQRVIISTMRHHFNLMKYSFLEV